MGKKIFAAGFFILFHVSLWAQAEKPLVQISPFVIEGLGSEEARIIETLIQSYITALGDVLSPSGSESPAEPLNVNTRSLRIPDYTFSGSITLEQDSRILVLEIGRPRTGERNSFTSVHRTTGELVLKVRSMIESAFSEGAAGLETIRTAEGELLSEGRIIGTWRGDKGIEMIRLQRGGRGAAIFSSGAQMDLSYSIENNTLKVVQNSPNTERYYHPVPFAVAKRLTGEAEPMRWELLLYEKGTVLRGIKVATGARYEGNTIIELLPGSARDAEWTRAGH
jgi:hypothetical protein